MSLRALTFVCTLLLISTNGENYGCNGVQYVVDGTTYFEPAGVCVNDMQYVCNGDTLQQYQQCGDSTNATNNVCDKIISTKGATSCTTYCDQELCPSALYTIYRVFYDGFIDSYSYEILCAVLWVSAGRFDPIYVREQYAYIANGNRCVPDSNDGTSKIYQCTSQYSGNITTYNGLNCQGNPTNVTEFVRTGSCTAINETAGRPEAWSCYIPADPTPEPTNMPSMDPTSDPTIDPTVIPTDIPTVDPTDDPIMDPTMYPTNEPTTMNPTRTGNPTSNPTMKEKMESTTMEPSKVLEPGNAMICDCKFCLVYIAIVGIFMIMFV